MFIGREKEIRLLEKSLDQKRSQLVVCTGRRRIGKSSLIEEFGRSAKHFFEFQGLHPKEAPTQSMQLAHFADSLHILFKRARPILSTWTEALHELSLLIPKQTTIIFLDEISWMSSGSKTFSAELKEAWDIKLKKHPHLILVLAGSVSSWIEENILNNSNFLGRVSLHLRLDEIPLNYQKNFWKERKNLVSNYDFLKTVAITGGVPRYLEEIDPKLSADQNILQLCFSETGILVNEFDKIFSDIFDRRSNTYKKIVEKLIQGPLTLSEITTKMKIKKSGTLSKYLNDLVISGFLSEDRIFDFNGIETKFAKFRIKDNYLRFALKYILPNQHLILNNKYNFPSLDRLPGWKSILGLQFENLVLNNRWKFVEMLEINMGDIISCAPYFQKKNTKNSGSCQIDLLIVTRSFQIYVCEIKFTAKINSDVITEVKRKIKVLKRPKHFTVIPVLIFAGEVSDGIIESEYFNLVSMDDFKF